MYIMSYLNDHLAKVMRRSRVGSAFIQEGWLSFAWRTQGWDAPGWLAFAPPLSLAPERFGGPRQIARGGLAPSARAVHALLSSVQKLARSFCLSVSGVVSPSAPGRSPISPARATTSRRAGERRIKRIGPRASHWPRDASNRGARRQIKRRWTPSYARSGCHVGEPPSSERSGTRPASGPRRRPGSSARPCSAMRGRRPSG
jgi:hypothetical protein